MDSDVCQFRRLDRRRSYPPVTVKIRKSVVAWPDFQNVGFFLSFSYLGFSALYFRLKAGDLALFSCRGVVEDEDGCPLNPVID